MHDGCYLMSGTVDTQSEISLDGILEEQWEMLLALYWGLREYLKESRTCSLGEGRISVSIQLILALL